MAKEKTEERRPGEILVGDKVNTPDGSGKVTAVTDEKILVDLENKKKGEFKPKQVSVE